MNKYLFITYKYLKFIKQGYPINPYTLFHQLLESQYWTTEKIKDFQLEKINNLLYIAFNSSDCYSKLLKGSDLPLKSIEEFNLKIPYITKEIIKRQYEKLKTEHFCYNYKHTTSGSTGDPLTIYTSGIAESYREAGLLRFFNWWNINPHDKSVFIWGKKTTIKSGNSLIDKIKKQFRRRYDINVFNLGPYTIKNYYDDINEFKPVFIRGYKSALLQFAELIEDKGLFFDNFKFKLAVVTSEVLRDEERNYIEKILNCKVANEYGTADAGQIAFECPNGSMHVFEEAVYLNTNRNNDVFVTEIHNKSMPLINYKNNDKVILSEKKCICGRNSQIISKIEGRDDDCLIKPNGEKINSNLFVYIIMELDDIGLDNCILKWKIIQNKNKFQVIIVPKQKYNKKVEEHIKKRFHEEIGREIIIEFSLVESIPRDNSGKLRLFNRIN